MGDLTPATQIIYAGTNIYGEEVRRDAVQYCSSTATGLAFGIVQAFLQYASNPNLKVAIVRVLERTDADPGKRESCS